MGNEKTSRVSVVIPVYNSQDYIGQTLDSVLAQDWLNKEIIVVNDGSTDDTEQVLRKFLQHILLVNIKNTGAAGARNEGIRHASGDVIAFLDADDIWDSGKLSIQMEYLRQNPEVGAVYCSWKEWRNNGSEISPKSKHRGSEKEKKLSIDKAKSGYIYNLLLKDVAISTISIAIRKSIINRVGYFDTDMPIGEDYDYWLRLSRETRIDKIDRVLAYYRKHDSGLTHAVRDVNFEYIVKKKAVAQWGLIGPDGQKTEKSTYRGYLSDVCFRFSYAHLQRGSILKGYTALLKSIYYSPYKLRGWAGLVKSVPRVVLRLLNLHAVR